MNKHISNPATQLKISTVIEHLINNTQFLDDDHRANISLDELESLSDGVTDRSTENSLSSPSLSEIQSNRKDETSFYFKSNLLKSVSNSITDNDLIEASRVLSFLPIEDIADYLQKTPKLAEGVLENLSKTKTTDLILSLFKKSPELPNTLLLNLSKEMVFSLNQTIQDQVSSFITQGDLNKATELIEKAPLPLDDKKTLLLKLIENNGAVAVMSLLEKPDQSSLKEPMLKALDALEVHSEPQIAVLKSLLPEWEDLSYILKDAGNPDGFDLSQTTENLHNLSFESLSFLLSKISQGQETPSTKTILQAISNSLGSETTPRQGLEENILIFSKFLANSHLAQPSSEFFQQALKNWQNTLEKHSNTELESVSSAALAIIQQMLHPPATQETINVSSLQTSKEAPVTVLEPTQQLIQAEQPKQVLTRSNEQQLLIDTCEKSSIKGVIIEMLGFYKQPISNIKATGDLNSGYTFSFSQEAWTCPMEEIKIPGLGNAPVKIERIDFPSKVEAKITQNKDGSSYIEFPDPSNAICCFVKATGIAKVVNDSNVGIQKIQMTANGEVQVTFSKVVPPTRSSPKGSWANWTKLTKSVDLNESQNFWFDVWNKSPKLTPPHPHPAQNLQGS